MQPCKPCPSSWHILQHFQVADALVKASIDLVNAWAYANERGEWQNDLMGWHMSVNKVLYQIIVFHMDASKLSIV